jgi:FkbM family methyltransferase
MDGCVNTSGRNYEMSKLRRYFLAFPPLRAMWMAGSKLKHRLIFSKQKHTKFDLRYFLVFPPLRAINLIISKLKLNKSRRGELVEFPVSDCVCPALRAKTCDIDIFELTFLLRDCDVKLQTEPRFIIDAGAHIGCAALFFASSFPRANIVAIEPDPGNYQVLLRNTRGNQRIRAIHAAVWHRPESVIITNEQDDPCAFQIKSANGQCATIQGLTVSAIIRDCGFENIDLLKLDIEGAEREIFGAGDLDWMNRTRAIMIELHDRFRPGCEAAFLNAARRFGFEITQQNTGNIVAQRT